MIVAENFSMLDGGIAAYTLDGIFRIAAASKAVPSENGLLSFQRLYGGLEVEIAQVYCELVSCELRLVVPVKKNLT
jgi:hypothetical protein